MHQHREDLLRLRGLVDQAIWYIDHPEHLMPMTDLEQVTFRRQYGADTMVLGSWVVKMKPKDFSNAAPIN